MSRLACCALVILGLAACSSSGKSATPSTTVACAPSPSYGSGDVTCLKRQFEQTVKRDPKDRYGWYNLGVIAQQEKDLNGAAGDFQRAIAIAPTFESPLYELGILRLQQGNYKSATTLLTRAVALNPNDANAHWKLGTALARFHTPAADAKATAELNKALVINPKILSQFPPPAVTPKSTTSTT